MSSRMHIATSPVPHGEPGKKNVLLRRALGEKEINKGAERPGTTPVPPDDDTLA